MIEKNFCKFLLFVGFCAAAPLRSIPTITQDHEPAIQTVNIFLSLLDWGVFRLGSFLGWGVLRWGVFRMGSFKYCLSPIFMDMAQTKD